MDRLEKALKIIDELLAKKNIREYIIFDITEEQSPGPDGISPHSGTLLTQSGKIFRFWFTWDSNGQYELGENSTYKDNGEEVSYWRERRNQQLTEYERENVVSTILSSFPGRIEKYYGVKSGSSDEVITDEMWRDNRRRFEKVMKDRKMLLEKIALKKGYHKSENEPDVDRVRKEIIEAWRVGIIKFRRDSRA